MLKNKRFLLTILLALVTIMLLQLQVKATEVDYSEYDYLLTETGVVATADLTGTETAIAGIKGEYTGEITVDVTSKKITINNFTASDLYLFDNTFSLWVVGQNNIQNINYKNNGAREVIADGNGKITYTNAYIRSDFIGSSYKDGKFTKYLGDSIDESVSQIYINLKEDSLDASGKILEDVAQRICEVIPYVSEYGLEMSVPNDTIIPASIFAKLKLYNNTFLCMWDDSCQFTFYGADIENTIVDFKIGVEFSSSPIGNMTIPYENMTIEYIKFKNTGYAPGKVEIHRNVGGAEEDEPDELCYIIIEAFNENTKSYEFFDNVADPYKTLSMLGKGAILYPQGGYAIYHAGYGAADEEWCVETEVDSLEWTEEDINKVLEAIEETRNNTTQKQLYIEVPTGSKVPAKIFESAKGIKINIISKDGIHASFLGENYKAIDYVAGGTISNKAIDGMVNVGEDTIVYLSLKHEGQLPSACVISYFNGMTDIGQGFGGDDTFVDTKLYYFNKNVQKYELCGSGYMSLPYDIYVFEIEHCSSYVMSEEELPDEFVIKTTTGENKEESKKEEVKKEETKDNTKAPGSLPYTGGTFVIIVSVLAIIALGIYAYRRNNDLKGI